MKKRILSLALALVMALSCAPIAGAAVSSSDAQAYLSAMEKRPDASAFLIDFDGNGKDELLLIWRDSDNYDDFSTSQKYFEVWCGSKKLISKAAEYSFFGTSLYIARKAGDSSKLYLVDNYGNDNWGYCMNAYSVVSNKWKLVDEFDSFYSYSDEDTSSFKINGQTYDHLTYLDLFRNTYDYVSSYDLSAEWYESQPVVREKLVRSVDTSLPLDDVLSSLSAKKKEALFDNFLCNLETFIGDGATVSDTELIQELQTLLSCSNFPFEKYSSSEHWGYLHRVFTKSEFTRLTTDLYGRSIDYSKFTRSSLPDSPWMEISFLYNGKFYLSALDGAGWESIQRISPLHVYQLDNRTFCAIYKFYDGDWYSEELIGIFSTVIKENYDGTWSILHRYPNGYIPTTDELSAFVAPSSWAKAEVEAADAAGLIPDLTGDPGWQDASTRLQFCQLAVQLAETALGETLPAAPANTFTDCSDLAVRKAYAAKIVNGMTETTFSPNGTLTREQLATMLWRAVNYIQTQSGQQALTGGGSLTGYTDAGSVSSYAKEAVSALNKNGIMKGTSNTALSPKGSCTVEQSVLLSYRTFLKLN